jgi:hypothetical protein
MAKEAIGRSVQRLAARQVLLAVVVIALAMVGLALLAEVLSDGGGTVYLAEIQPATGTAGVPSLVAVGYGQASSPADTAHVQLLISLGGDESFSSVAFAPTANATPGAAERQAAAPVVNAILATGTPAEAVQVVTSAAFGSGLFDSGVPTFRIDVSLHDPRLEAIARLVDAAGQAAAANGLQLAQVGAGYAVADCGSLRSAAWQAAVADARTRATAQAELLAVELGDLLVSQETAADAPGSLGAATLPGACSPVQQQAGLFNAGAVTITVPPFDPTAEPIATAFAQVSLAFEIVRD